MRRARQRWDDPLRDINTNRRIAALTPFSPTEDLILPEVFEREICRGFQHVSIGRELERLGHLRRGTEKNYLMSRETLPELGRKRVYVVTAEAKQEDELNYPY